MNEDSGIETNRAMKREGERERDGKREGKGETESEGIQRESSREGGKTVDGIGGAKLSGGGLIKPS